LLLRVSLAHCFPSFGCSLHGCGRTGFLPGSAGLNLDGVFGRLAGDFLNRTLAIHFPHEAHPSTGCGAASNALPPDPQYAPVFNPL
jgi:hypothetical protein